MVKRGPEGQDDTSLDREHCGQAIHWSWISPPGREAGHIFQPNISFVY